jgi:hypothetical protein
MQFLLTGFSDDVGFRVFAFQGVATDKTRSPFSVRADITLIRKYGIRVQELPLLCRGILELRNEGEPVRAVVFTEEDMRLHAVHAAEEKEAAARKKPRRQPATPQEGAVQPGSGWRGPAQQGPQPVQPEYRPWTIR